MRLMINTARIIMATLIAIVKPKARDHPSVHQIARENMKTGREHATIRMRMKRTTPKRFSLVRLGRMTVMKKGTIHIAFRTIARRICHHVNREDLLWLEFCDSRLLVCVVVVVDDELPEDSSRS